MQGSSLSIAELCELDPKTTESPNFQCDNCPNRLSSHLYPLASTMCAVPNLCLRARVAACLPKMKSWDYTNKYSGNHGATYRPRSWVRTLSLILCECLHTWGTVRYYVHLYTQHAWHSPAVQPHKNRSAPKTSSFRQKEQCARHSQAHACSTHASAAVVHMLIPSASSKRIGNGTTYLYTHTHTHKTTHTGQPERCFSSHT